MTQIMTDEECRKYGVEPEDEPFIWAELDSFIARGRMAEENRKAEDARILQRERDLWELQEHERNENSEHSYEH